MSQTTQQVSQPEQTPAAGPQLPTAPTSRNTNDRTLEDNSPNRGTLTPAQVASTLPMHGLALGYVIRTKGGLLSQSKYTFHFERRDQFVLASRKREHKQTSNYLLSIDPSDLDRNSESFFSKVRSNFGGTEFVFYDAGEGDQRAEIGAVLYEADPAGLKGPRRMQVILPRVSDSTGEMEIWRPKNETETLIAEFRRNRDSERIIVLQNKPPQWNETLRAFQLNFHGRVSVSSVKNCQLVDARQPNRLVMQFGKVTSERFSLDFQFPLNATQAFCIALTSFDNKLLCE
jgi:tubby-related protein 1